jgi:putative transcriptional regulator
MRIIAHSQVFMKARIVNGLSQRELAKRSGLSNAYISMIERGEKSVGPGTAKRLSELLDKHVEELFRIE